MAGAAWCCSCCMTLSRGYAASGTMLVFWWMRSGVMCGQVSRCDCATSLCSGCKSGGGTCPVQVTPSTRKHDSPHGWAYVLLSLLAGAQSVLTPQDGCQAALAKFECLHAVATGTCIIARVASQHCHCYRRGRWSRSTDTGASSARLGLSNHMTPQALESFDVFPAAGGLLSLTVQSHGLALVNTPPSMAPATYSASKSD